MKNILKNQTANVTPDRAQAMRKLTSQPEWEVFEEMVDELLSANAFNFLAWIESEDWDVERQARDVRGKYHFWEELLAMLKKAVNYEKEPNEEPVD